MEDAQSRIISALPFCIVRSPFTGNRIVSLPFTSYCDPLVSSPEEFPDLLGGLIDLMGSVGPARYYELRVFGGAENIDDDRLKKHSYHKIHVLDLRQGFESLRKSFHRDCIKKSVRKAERSGIIIRDGASEQDLKSYYLHHAQTRKRLGLPIQPYSFFRNMWDIMKPPGYFSLFMAELEGKVIGGLIVFRFRDTLSLEHIGTDLGHLLLRPNHLLYFKAIETACAEGLSYADFGKTTADNQGLLDFKRRWGATQYDVTYFYYPHVKGMMALEDTSAKHKFFVNIGKRMPLVFARGLGRIAYRHMG
ncbi:MAG: FemAB family protein [Syntrophorhabdaceae bacterium PtaU1.Bin034]|jgi:lipid II:glycine glycyltransferase (peptidoglycan interpeptide bridge formation enzyme)|nr:MAG: FemAB family protein [Syntrophorhabdaceae bacterium PtaU1.Bin034]